MEDDAVGLDVDGKIFPSVAVGYAQPEGQTFTVTNTTTRGITFDGLTASLSDGTAFTLSALPADSIAPGAGVTVIATPKTGLAAGEYYDYVELRGSNNLYKKIELYIQVHETEPTLPEGVLYSENFSRNTFALRSEWTDVFNWSPIGWNTLALLGDDPDPTGNPVTSAFTGSQTGKSYLDYWLFNEARNGATYSSQIGFPYTRDDESTPNYSGIAYKDGMDWTNYTMEFSMQFSARTLDTNKGILFRTSENNGYMISFYTNMPQTITISKIVDGERILLADPVLIRDVIASDFDPTYNHGVGLFGVWRITDAPVWYDMKIEACGSNLKYYIKINGEWNLVFDVEDDTFASGSVGFHTERSPVFFRNLTVTKIEISATGISLDYDSLSMNVGDTDTLTATIEPEDATNKNVTWSSDNETVAEVADGVVTAKSTGTTTITATTADGGYTARCVVMVTAVPPEPTPTPTPTPGRNTGGSSTASGQAIPAAGNVAVSYTQSGSSVALSVPDSKITEIIEKSNGEVPFDLSGVSGATAAVLPKGALDTLAGAGLDVEIKLPQGTVKLDTDALQSIASAAQDANVSVSLRSVDVSSLSAAQQAALESGDKVVDISILSGTRNITSFNGVINAAMPYTGPIPVSVWYLSGDGTLKKLACSYDEESKTVSFELPGHLSLYVIGQDTGVPAWANPFTDIKESDWFYGDVEFVVKNSLFNGTGAAIFNPDMPMTRGMLVTVLGRLYGVNVNGYAASSFGDVAAGQYYAPYVEWAKEAGIVGGVGNNKFAPDSDISRQDLAVIVMRYAEYADKQIPVTQQSVAFTDEAVIRDYAKSAIRTLYKGGIISGVGNNRIDPQGSATRAQVSAILHRFIEKTQ